LVHLRRIEPDRHRAAGDRDHVGGQRRKARIANQRQDLPRRNPHRQRNPGIADHRRQQRHRRPAQIGYRGRNPILQRAGATAIGGRDRRVMPRYLPAQRLGGHRRAPARERGWRMPWSKNGWIRRF